MKPEPAITLVLDTKLMRPACVLLQAVYGCGANNGLLAREFDPVDWLVSPTPDMKRIEGTLEQWRQLAGKLRERRRSIR